MRGLRYGLGLAICLCWATATFAQQAVDAAASPKEGESAIAPASTGAVPEEKKKFISSAERLRNKSATPDEDFEAGDIANARGELIEAQGLFERAARRGHAKAMARLAEILIASGYIGEAAEWYKKGAELDDPDAQYGYGALYLDSYSYANVDGKVKQINFPAARKWIGLAAEQGHPSALVAFAKAYMEGGLGLTEAERSDAEILKWITRAADVGQSPEMMYVLAEAYRSGKYGLKIDTQKANEWTEKANKLLKKKTQEVKTKKKRILQ